jgi:hypothetical protein
MPNVIAETGEFPGGAEANKAADGIGGLPDDHIRGVMADFRR